MAAVESQIQGGGQRGGPRRWTGNGPRPARHIPWPELFKHHQSVLTGHLKMMDMVRKHCVEGTGNHTTAQACVDRTHEMLRMFKKATATFVPPRDNIDRVPLGASSASMYPGYSPADHIYGEAASEYGKQMAELRQKGVEVPRDPNGPEYDVATDKKNSKIQIEEIKRARGAQKQVPTEESAIGDPMEGVEETDPSQLFMIDSNPTPVAQLPTEATSSDGRGKNKANDKAKRRYSGQECSTATNEPTTTETHKKKKVKVEKLSSDIQPPASDEFEKEVAVRHKEKEEKRKAEKEKKRKRESENSQELGAGVVAIAGKPSTEKPEKKKSKKDKVKEETEVTQDNGGVGTIEQEKAKREKNKKRISLNGETAEGDGDGEAKKKRRKEKASLG